MSLEDEWKEALNEAIKAFPELTGLMYFPLVLTLNGAWARTIGSVVDELEEHWIKNKCFQIIINKKLKFLEKNVRKSVLIGGAVHELTEIELKYCRNEELKDEKEMEKMVWLHSYKKFPESVLDALAFHYSNSDYLGRRIVCEFISTLSKRFPDVRSNFQKKITDPRYKLTK